jgi:hypothetical protein
MTNSIEYAGTLYRNIGQAQFAAIQTFLIDGSFTEQNFKMSNEEIADEILSSGWEIPEFEGTREDLIDLVDQAKEDYFDNQ